MDGAERFNVVLKISLIFFLLSAAGGSRIGSRASRHYRTRAEGKSEFPSKSSSGGDVCEGWWCESGKECRPGFDGLPHCVCLRVCPSGEKAVCGTDGQRYESECELRKEVCLSKSNTLAIDPSRACEEKKKDSDEDDFSDDDFEFDETEEERKLGDGKTNKWLDAEIPDSAEDTHNDDDEEDDEEVGRRISPCSQQEYELFKDRVVLHSHERMIGAGRMSPKRAVKKKGNSHPRTSPLNEETGEGGKDYLLSLMFSHFDRNNDGALESDELVKTELEEKLLNSSPCRLPDLLKFDDSDKNGRVDLNEFYSAFNKLYSVSVISLDKSVAINRISAMTGENVEMKCDIAVHPRFPVTWRRYKFDLSPLNDGDKIRIFPDGTLYISNVELFNAGNYSCNYGKITQTHILSVQTLPDVRVEPHIIWERPGSEVSMECRVVGEPFPVVRWLKNDEPLSHLASDGKFSITGDGIRLTLKDAYFSDTAAFMCEAENSAGRRVDISSLVVIDRQTPEKGKRNTTGFFVFHSNGISVYNPANCRVEHHIQATDIIPGTQGNVCDSHCEWGRGIKVGSSYVYVSQPTLDRVLVISILQMVVVDVIPTDRSPVELTYVTHLDQVWVESWRDSTGKEKSIQVIREGRERKKHLIVHPELKDSQFHTVGKLFLPPNSKLSSQYRHGYVTRPGEPRLFKLDLIGLRYSETVIELGTYNNCLPRHLVFSSLYGMIIVDCSDEEKESKGQLIFDVMTESVIGFRSDHVGVSYLSPDSRSLVKFHHTPDGSNLLVQALKENGLEFSFDVKTSLNLSDIAFFPSQRSQSYDLYASSLDKENVLFLNLESGKVELMSGVGLPPQSKPQWGNKEKPISAQGLFSKFLVTLSKNSIFVLHQLGTEHTVNCQVGGLSNPTNIVWL